MRLELEKKQTQEEEAVRRFDLSSGAESRSNAQLELNAGEVVPQAGESRIDGCPPSSGSEVEACFSNYYQADLQNYYHQPFDVNLQPSNFSYAYGHYGPTYCQTENELPSLEFHAQPINYDQFPPSSSLIYNQHSTEEPLCFPSNSESKLESFSELLQGRFIEPSICPESMTDAHLDTSSQEEEKPSSCLEECETENFGEIIKKTMVESASA